MISYLHHFFAEYAIGVTNVHLNADNSAGQNKNNLKLFYLAYRVACGLHKSVHLQFMLAGHTKFSPDWCFGLMDLSPAGRDDQGEVCVETYDWKSFLSSGKKVSNIQKCHHFTFTHDEPGVVYVREHIDSEPVRFVLFSKPVQGTPSVIQAPGLDQTRQSYLFKGQLHHRGLAVNSIK